MKTASTSVEIFFQKYCSNKKIIRSETSIQQEITPVGIIGSRGKNFNNSDLFYNHMPAFDVRNKLGKKIFDEYFKFCTIRNPFAKTVSRFWWDLRIPDDLRDQILQMDFVIIKENFRNFLLSKGNAICDDRAVYSIDNKLVEDDLIRYENLINDMKRISEKLNIDFQDSELGTFRSGFNFRPEHYTEYYDNDCLKQMKKAIDFEFSEFGYTYS